MSEATLPVSAPTLDGAIAWTASEAHQRIAAGEITPAEYAAQLATRMPLAQQLGAVLSTDTDAMIEAARSLEEVEPEARRPLSGIPVCFKDVFDVAGEVTTGGTPGLATNTRSATAAVIGALLDAGAILGPRLNLHELSFGITSNNHATGPVRNPYDPSRIAGGSSGGSAVAVAIGLTPIALGADTGGSVRVPAAYCGVVGYRPTPGRYASTGILPISPSRDTAGILARSVTDIQLVDDVLAATGPQPAVTAPIEADGLRIGIPAEFTTSLEPGVAVVFDSVRQRLQDNGIHLIEISLADLVSRGDKAGLTICLHEFLHALPAYLRDATTPISLDTVRDGVVSPDVRKTWHVCGKFTDRLDDYRSALDEQSAVRDAYAERLAAHDVVAMAHPTSPVTAPAVGDDTTIELDGEQVDTYWTIARHANFAGAVGLPGISLPAGTVPAGCHRAGMPVGVELETAAGDDDRLLAIAHLLAPVLSA